MNMNEREIKEMNSPVRRVILKYVDFRIFRSQLKKHHIDLTNKVILDVGCGCGFGSEIIAKKLRPKELVAFDAMPEQVEQAKKYFNKKRIPVNLFIGDVTDIKLESNKFDAVFAFAVLHHVPKWRKALKEINRVLKKGGVFLIEEPNKEILDSVDHLYDHPEEAKFMWPEFINGLEEAGFRVVEDKRYLKNGSNACIMCEK